MNFAFDFTFEKQLQNLEKALLNTFEKHFRAGQQNYVEIEKITSWPDNEGDVLKMDQLTLSIRYGRFYEDDNDLNFSKNMQLPIDYNATIEEVCAKFDFELELDDLGSD